ncbi:MAG: hypothetical protein ACMUHY_03315 [Thermoplasmatota archaeon]
MEEKEIIFEESEKDFNDRSKTRKYLGIFMILFLGPSLLMATVVTIAVDFPKMLPFGFLFLLMLVGSFFFGRWYYRRIKEAGPLVIYRKGNREYFDLNGGTFRMDECLLKSYPSSFEVYYYSDEEKKVAKKMSVYWVKDEAKNALFKRWVETAEKEVQKEQERKKIVRKKEPQRAIDTSGLTERQFLSRYRFSEMVYFHFGKACELLAPALIVVFILGGGVFGFMMIFWGTSWFIHDLYPLAQLCSLVVISISALLLVPTFFLTVKVHLKDLKGTTTGISVSRKGLQIRNHVLKGGENRITVIDTIPYGMIRSVGKARPEKDPIPYLRFGNPYINERFGIFCPPFTLKNRIVVITLTEGIMLTPFFMKMDIDDVSEIEKRLFRTIYVSVERRDQDEFISRLGMIIGK